MRIIVAMEGDPVSEAIRFPTGKAIIFRYIGGTKDGCVTRFIVGCTPFDPVQMQPYEIVEQSETENVLTVTWGQKKPDG